MDPILKAFAYNDYEAIIRNGKFQRTDRTEYLELVETTLGGKPHGLVISYVDELLSSVYTLTRGVEDGPMVTFHRKGRPEIISIACGKDTIGPMYKLSEHGNLIGQTNWIITKSGDNVPHGDWKEWVEDYRIDNFGKKVWETTLKLHVVYAAGVIIERILV